MISIPALYGIFQTMHTTGLKWRLRLIVVNNGFEMALTKNGTKKLGAYGTGSIY
jgi:hypothetical protein